MAIEGSSIQIENNAIENGQSLVNREEVMDRLGNDEALLQSVIHLFYETYPVYLIEIENAINSGYTHVLEKSAHAFSLILQTDGF